MQSRALRERDDLGGRGRLILASKSSEPTLSVERGGAHSPRGSAPRLDERAVEEHFIAEGGPIGDLAMCLAEAKAVAVSCLRPEAYCIGADQTLMVGERLLHKSRDFGEAASSLAALSGRTHRLTSAFCVARGGKPLYSESNSADLHMRSPRCG